MSSSTSLVPSPVPLYFLTIPFSQDTAYALPAFTLPHVKDNKVKEDARTERTALPPFATAGQSLKYGRGRTPGPAPTIENVFHYPQTGKIYNGKTFVWYSFEGEAKVTTPPIPPATSGILLQKGDLMIYSYKSANLPALIWVCLKSNESHGGYRLGHKDIWKRVDEGFSLQIDDKTYVLKIRPNGKPRWITKETVARSLRQ